MTDKQDALAKLTTVSPKLVEEVKENPEVYKTLSRGLAALGTDLWARRVLTNDAPVSALKEFTEYHAKVGGLVPEKAAAGSAAGGGGFSININLGDKQATIEAKPPIDAEKS